MGAVPGALPPVTGWVAARDDFGVGAAVLFGILFLWQLPHTLAIARLYRVDVKQVKFFVVEQLLTIKISIPRRVFSGDVGDTDIYGGQFHSPLVRLPVKD